MVTFAGALVLVAPIFSIALTGFFVRKAGLLTVEADRSLLRLTVNILVPCLAFDVIIGNESLRDPHNLLFPPVAGFLSILITFAMALATARLLKVPIGTRSTFAYTAGIQNYAYLAIPVCAGLFDRDVLGALFAYNLGVELAFWGIGGLVLGENTREAWRQAISTPVIAIVLSASLNLAGVRQWEPVWIHQAIHLLGSCAVPLGVILTGAMLADHAAPAQLFGGWKVIAGSVLLRHAVFPLLYLAGAVAPGVPRELRSVLIVQGAMPAAVFTIVVCKLRGGDMKTALRVVLVSSTLGLVTIPFWIKAGLYFIRHFAA